MAQNFQSFQLRLNLLLLYMLVIVTITYTESLLSHDEECLALYQFKQIILNQDQSYSTTHWFPRFDSWKINGSNCCLWDGVTCGSKKKDYGHVIGLDLSGSFFRVPLNSSNVLFNLVHLQRLNLAMNDFGESQIPSEIGRLNQLRSLNLSNSKFTGQIPNEISELILLSSLDLSQNALKLQSPSFENLMANLTMLEEVDFSGVNISSSVPHFLANFSSLRSIKLKDCLLQNEFPKGILDLPEVKIINLGFNLDLSGYLPEFHNNNSLEYLSLASTGFFGVLPDSISNLKHLTYLNLRGCSFSGEIPGSLANMSQLAYLALGQNELTGQVPSLASISELTILEFSDNQLEIGCVPDWLLKLTKLSEFYANNLNIKCEIPAFLGNLTRLTKISLRSNSIFGAIPSSFTNMTQLRLLELGHNQLHGSISRSFSNFKSLELFGLYNNFFSGTVYLDMFIGLNKLEALSLGDNSISFVASNNYTNETLPELKYLILSKCNLGKFPAFLRFQRKLITLDLSNNGIYGLVPVWMWNNSRETLQTLSLSSNYITGFNHEHPLIIPWVRLEVLFLPYNELQGRLPIPPNTTRVYEVRGNHLIGEIPPLICEVASLRVLDLSSNNMTGTLPPCLGNLSNSLSNLDLKQNNFHGPMMNSFTHGCVLKTIDLSENRFTGQVSESLANCTTLEFLSLGDNSLEDVFPLWLGALPELQVLIMSSNKFYGAIQGLKTLSPQFLKLRIIDLSNNNFSGHLPDKSFQTWDAMKFGYGAKLSTMGFVISMGTLTPFEFPYSMTLTNKGVKREYEKILNIFTAIDLSCNNFEGEIPPSLKHLQGLESLNLSNNHLSGSVLTSLGNLKNLESLDLSQNDLSGNIPQELLQLGFLAFLNVSFNHFHGPIPQGKQFSTFENNSYMGNPKLCGKPLSKECQNSKAPTSNRSPTSNQYESLLPSDKIDWIIIFLGVSNGLVIGVILGNFHYGRCSNWFNELFGVRKDKWVRPLRNTRKNQVLN